MNSFRECYKTMVNETSTEKNINLNLNRKNDRLKNCWKPLLVGFTCFAMLIVFNFLNNKNDFVYLPLINNVETDYSGGSDIKLLGVFDDNVYYALTITFEAKNITEIYRYSTEDKKTEKIYQLESSILLLVDDYLIYVNADQTNKIEIMDTNDLVHNDLYLFEQNTLIKSMDYQDHYLFIVYENNDGYGLVRLDIDTKQIDFEKELNELVYLIDYDDDSLLYLNSNNEVQILNLDINVSILPIEVFNESIKDDIDMGVFQAVIVNGKIYFINNVGETSLWYYDLSTKQIIEQTTLVKESCFIEKIYYDTANNKLYIALQDDNINKIYCFDIKTNKIKLIAEFEYGRVWKIFINKDDYVVSVDDGIIIGNIR